LKSKIKSKKNPSLLDSVPSTTATFVCVW